MTLQAARPWWRLAPLAGAVLGAHLLLLDAGGVRLAPVRETGPRFVTRTIAPAPWTTPAAATVAPEVAPAPAMAAAPAATRPPTPAAPKDTARARAAWTEPAAMPAAQGAEQPSGPRPSASLAPASPPPPGAEQEVAALPAAPAGAALPPVRAMPESARLHYVLTLHTRGSRVSGEARLDWRHDGQAYQARMELAAPGFPGRVQRSAGRLGAAGLEPVTFSDQYRGTLATHFDRDKGLVVFSSNRPRAVLAAGMQDRLSVIVQLSVLVASDPARFTPGSEIVIPTAGSHEAGDWIFRLEGEEDLQLPGGDMRALKLQRQPRGAYDPKLELWLAPGLDYAPVRLRLTNPDGGVVEQRWASTDRG